eukprot:TRINITY_DN12485_c0_g1_i1.p1 TRINITY_DN12485_c0_g1~~TRINITY_DN12485_c0_g1_i1.p1  ORF type:complete len:775 (-),score=98.84 TRINITY_DN12485_c0_g1_i1:120-2444(-)
MVCRRKHQWFYSPQCNRRRNRLYDARAFKIFYQKQVTEHEDDEDIVLRESTAGTDAASVMTLEEDEDDEVSPLMLDSSPRQYQRDVSEVELGEDGDSVKANKMLKMINAVPRRKQIRRIWDWIRTVVKYDENKVFLTYGIDMTLYLQFLRQLIVIFSILSVLGLCVLIPVNVSGNSDVSDGSYFNMTCLGNIDEKDPRLWVHLGAVYVFTIGIIVFVFRTYNNYISTVYKYKKLPLPQNYSVLVKNIPKDITTSQQLKEHFERMYPGQILSSSLLFDLSKIRDRINKRKKYQKRLDVALTSRETSGQEPQHVSGHGGPRRVVQTIPHYTEKIARLTQEIDEERAKVDSADDRLDYKPLGMGFVTFQSKRIASLCANSVNGPRSGQWTVKPAPAPVNLQWKLLHIGKVQSFSRTALVVLAVIFLIFFWGIPVGFLAQFANLHTLSQFRGLDKLVEWVYELPSFLVSVITRYLPALVIMLFMVLLVPLLKLLAKQEKPITKSGKDTSVFQKYYAFLIFNVLLLSSVSSQLSTIARIVISDPTQLYLSIAKTLGSTLPTFGAFFIVYTLNALFSAAATDITRLGDGILYLLRRIFKTSKRDQIKAKRKAAGRYNYGVSYALHLNIATIVLCYSSMVPIILPVGLLYFVTWYIIQKSNMMLIHYQAYDSGGRFTPMVLRRLLLANIFYNIIMFGIFLVKEAFLASSLTFPLPFLSVWAILHAVRNYETKARFLPVYDFQKELKASDLGFANCYQQPELNGLRNYYDDSDHEDMDMYTY